MAAEGTNAYDLTIAIIGFGVLGCFLYAYKKEIGAVIKALSDLVGKTEEAFGMKFNRQSYDDLLEILQNARNEAKGSSKDKTIEAIDAAIQVLETADEPGPKRKPVHFELAPQQFAILEKLQMSENGASFDELIEVLKKDGNPPTKNHLAVIMAGLRKEGYSIQVKKGFGYRLVSMPDDD